MDSSLHTPIVMKTLEQAFMHRRPGKRLTHHSDKGCQYTSDDFKSLTQKEKACISIAGHSLQYGSTCFAGIRGYIREGKVRIFRLRDYHDRLMNASKIFGFGFNISYEDFEQIIASMVVANSPESDFYIRPFLFSENEVIGVCYDKLQFDLGIYMIPLPTYYQSDKELN